jgi:hypothetical protein
MRTVRAGPGPFGAVRDRPESRPAGTPWFPAGTGIFLHPSRHVRV